MREAASCRAASTRLGHRGDPLTPYSSAGRPWPNSRQAQSSPVRARVDLSDGYERGQTTIPSARAGRTVTGSLSAWSPSSRGARDPAAPTGRAQPEGGPAHSSPTPAHGGDPAREDCRASPADGQESPVIGRFLLSRWRHVPRRCVPTLTRTFRSRRGLGQAPARRDGRRRRRLGRRETPDEVRTLERVTRGIHSERRSAPKHS